MSDATIAILHGVGITQDAGHVAALVGIPLRIDVVGLVDVLGAGGQTVDNLEEQLAVIAHVLAVGGNHVIVQLVHRVGSGVHQSLFVP